MVTVTFTAPAACAGVSQVIVVAFTTATLVAGAPPKVTVVSGVVVKLLPVTVIGVPPSVGPCCGATLEIEGGVL